MQPAFFDSYAESYDEDFSFSPIGKMQRARVHHFLKPYLLNKKHVLEINCGTGEDARWLSSQGLKVEASDISEGMIEVCNQKNVPANFSACDSRDLLSKYTSQQFDMIFSNFGGLNCLSPEEIKKFMADSSHLLKPNGIVAAVIMGRNCMWERYYFSKKKDQRQNRRLAKTGVDTIIKEEHFLTYYYSPDEFYIVGKEYYELMAYKPIGLFVPPSWFNQFFKSKKGLLHTLYFFEKLFPVSFFADKADHYLILLQKRA